MEPEPRQAQPLDSIVGPVTVPLLQAAITGLLVGALVCVLLLWARVSWWFPGWVTVTIGCMLFSWLAYRGRWQYIIERVLMVDLNHDGFVGAPQPPKLVRVQLEQDQGRQVDWIDLPMPEKLPQLASGLVAGDPFSLRRWTSELNVYSQGEFSQIQKAFLERGLAQWKSDDHRQGVELTRAGKVVCKRLASETPALPYWDEGRGA